MLDWDTIYWIHEIELWRGIVGLVLILIYFCVVLWIKKQKEIKKLKLKQQEMQERKALTTEDKGEIKMKYRKKPIEVEAIQWNGFNLSDIEEFAGRSFFYDVVDEYNVCDHILSGIEIRTLYGDMKANIGDYIIKGINGEFYPCKEDIFLKTYEPMEE